MTSPWGMRPEMLTGALDTARIQAGLSVDQLWVRYFGNGGTATADEFAAFLADRRQPGALQYDIAVSALNDRFTEMALHHPVPYSDAGSGDHGS